MNQDKDYNPGVDMCANVVDDEQTIEEEENLSDDLDNSNEIEKLKEESEMPLESLLLMYKQESVVHKSENNTNKFQEGNDPNCSNIKTNGSFETAFIKTNEDTDEETDDDYDEKEDFEDYENSDIADNDYVHKKNKDLLNLMNNSNSYSEDDDHDFDPDIISESSYVPKIKVGPEHQVEIDVLPQIRDSTVVELKDYDELLWNGYKLDEDDVLNYLKEIQNVEDFSNLKEDKRALDILNQCSYKVNDAIVQYREIKPSKKQWTEEENDAFEEGFKECGKNFRAIQETKCKGNTVAEIVEYYYLWKKTERHDVFVNKYKIKKKNQLLHPSTTDFIEKFLLDREQSMMITSSVNTTQRLPTTNDSVVSLKELPHETNELVQNVKNDCAEIENKNTHCQIELKEDETIA